MSLGWRLAPRKRKLQPMMGRTRYVCGSLNTFGERMNPLALRWFVESAIEAGVPSDQLFAGLAVSQAELQTAREVDIWDYSHIMHRVARLSPPGLGRSCGEQFTCEKLGAPGLLMLTSRTLLDSTRSWNSYGALVQFPVFGQVHFGKTEWQYHFGPTIPASESVWRFATQALVACLATLAAQICGRQLLYDLAELPYPQRSTDDPKLYNAREIRFGRPRAILTGRLAELDTPGNFADDHTNRALTRHCEIALAAHRKSMSLHDRIIQIFARTTSELPQIGELARELGMSTRTLQRNIGAEGLSYRKIIDEFRSKLLVLMDEEADAGVKEAAYQLRFGDSNGIYRLRQRHGFG